MSDIGVHSNVYQRVRDYGQLIDEVLLGLRTSISSASDPARRKLGELLAGLASLQQTDLRTAWLSMLIAADTSSRSAWAQVGRALLSTTVDAEVIDMLSLSPFDEDIILESVKKTNRVVIVDEDTPRASMASEFAAIIADKAFDYLDAPVKRVTAPHTPVPYNRGLEKAFMPQPDDVVRTVNRMLGKG